MQQQHRLGESPQTTIKLADLWLDMVGYVPYGFVKGWPCQLRKFQRVSQDRNTACRCAQVGLCHEGLGKLDETWVVRSYGKHRDKALRAGTSFRRPLCVVVSPVRSGGSGQGLSWSSVL